MRAPSSPCQRNISLPRISSGHHQSCSCPSIIATCRVTSAGTRACRGLRQGKERQDGCQTAGSRVPNPPFGVLHSSPQFAPTSTIPWCWGGWPDSQHTSLHPSGCSCVALCTLGVGRREKSAWFKGVDVLWALLLAAGSCQSSQHVWGWDAGGSRMGPQHQTRVPCSHRAARGKLHNEAFSCPRGLSHGWALRAAFLFSSRRRGQFALINRKKRAGFTFQLGLHNTRLQFVFVLK